MTVSHALPELTYRCECGQTITFTTNRTPTAWLAEHEPHNTTGGTDG